MPGGRDTRQAGAEGCNFRTLRESVRLETVYTVSRYMTKQRKTTSWLKIPKFSATAFLGSLFLTTKPGYFLQPNHSSHNDS